MIRSATIVVLTVTSALMALAVTFCGYYSVDEMVIWQSQSDSSGAMTQLTLQHDGTMVIARGTICTAHGTHMRRPARFSVSIPLLALMLMCLSYPTIAFIRGPLRRRRRMRRGRCIRCGYDLKRNASGTCPDCGTRVNDADTRCP